MRKIMYFHDLRGKLMIRAVTVTLLRPILPLLIGFVFAAF